MPFYKTLETLETGPLSYASEFEIFGTRLEKIINKPHMTPEVSDGEFVVIPANSTTQTLTFTAPEDLTISNLILYPTARESLANTTYLSDVTALLFMSRLSIVSGTGPDVGVPLYEGAGAACLSIFAIRNVAFAPKLDIRMAAGDVLEMDITSGLSAAFALSMAFTYEPEINNNVSPKLLLGGPTGPFGGGALGGGTAASATLTVNAASTTEPIQFIKNSSALTVGVNNTESIFGTPGGSSDAYNSTAGSATLIRDDIINVITNTHSSFGFWNDWNITPSGATDIVFTRDDFGASGNYDIIFVDTPDFTATTFTGGTSPTINISVSSPSINVNIKELFLSTISNLFSPSPNKFFTLEVVGIEVDSVGIPIGRGIFSPTINIPSVKKVNVPVTAGQTVDVLARNSSTTTVPVYLLIVAERA